MKKRDNYFRLTITKYATASSPAVADMASNPGTAGVVVGECSGKGACVGVTVGVGVGFGSEAVKSGLTKIAVKATKSIVPIILFIIYPILYKAVAYLRFSFQCCQLIRANPTRLIPSAA